MKNKLKTVREFSVIWKNRKGKWMQFDTDCKDTAIKTKVKKQIDKFEDVQMYYRPKIQAEKRLQRIYFRKFLYEGLTADDVYYPNLFTF